MRREVKKDGTTVLDGMSLSDILLAVHPIGSYYMSESSTDPATLFGGTWVRVKGQVIVGLDEAQTEFDTAGETGGEKTHVLTVAEMPAHKHKIWNFVGGPAGGGWNWAGQGSTLVSDSGSTGGGGAHNNLQPYVVAYMWKRTA